MDAEPNGSQSLVSAYAAILIRPPAWGGPLGTGVAAVRAIAVGAGVLVGRCVAAGGGVAVGADAAGGWVAGAAGAATVEPGPGALAPVAGLDTVGAAAAGAAPESEGADGAGASAPPHAVPITKTATMAVTMTSGLILYDIDAKASLPSRKRSNIERIRAR